MKDKPFTFLRGLLRRLRGRRASAMPSPAARSVLLLKRRIVELQTDRDAWRDRALKAEGHLSGKGELPVPAAEMMALGMAQSRLEKAVEAAGMLAGPRVYSHYCCPCGVTNEWGKECPQCRAVFPNRDHLRLVVNKGLSFINLTAGGTGV